MQGNDNNNDNTNKFPPISSTSYADILMEEEEATTMMMKKMLQQYVAGNNDDTHLILNVIALRGIIKEHHCTFLCGRGVFFKSKIEKLLQGLQREREESGSQVMWDYRA